MLLVHLTGPQAYDSFFDQTHTCVIEERTPEITQCHTYMVTPLNKEVPLDVLTELKMNLVLVLCRRLSGIACVFSFMLTFQ